MPTAGTCLFFQGLPDPSGALFGDGLLCTTGSVVRLGARVNVGGAAELPSGSDPTLSVLGGVTPGSGVQRSYQVWFRAVQSFCTPAPFNVSNGLRVTW